MISAVNPFDMPLPLIRSSCQGCIHIHNCTQSHPSPLATSKSSSGICECAAVNCHKGCGPHSPEGPVVWCTRTVVCTQALPPPPGPGGLRASSPSACPSTHPSTCPTPPSFPSWLAPSPDCPSCQSHTHHMHTHDATPHLLTMKEFQTFQGLRRHELSHQVWPSPDRQALWCGVEGVGAGLAPAPIKQLPDVHPSIPNAGHATIAPVRYVRQGLYTHLGGGGRDW